MEASKQRRPPRNIPDDIVRAILPRLPVKTLLRFKSVCKLWHSIISDPNFRLATQNRKRAIAISYSRSDISDTTYHSITDELSIDRELCPNPTAHYRTINENNKGGPTFVNHDHTRLLGSCNGLVLISLDEHIFLWNPSTRCCRKVLELQALVLPGNIVAVSGLCYDSSIDDYKAIVLVSNEKFVQFASLKTKNWRFVETPFYNCGCHGDPVVNKRLHWLSRDQHPCRYTSAHGKIACFDSSTNKFETLPMPKMSRYEVDIAECGVLALGVLDECLCLIRKQLSLSNYEVLVMKQYDVKKSWTRMFVLRNVGFPFQGPLFFTRGGEALLFQTFRAIVAYNVKQGYCWRILGNNDRNHKLIVHTYVESLVSPVGYEWNDTTKKRKRRMALKHDYEYCNK